MVLGSGSGFILGIRVPYFRTKVLRKVLRKYNVRKYFRRTYGVRMYLRQYLLPEIDNLISCNLPALPQARRQLHRYESTFEGSTEILFITELQVQGSMLIINTSGEDNIVADVNSSSKKRSASP